MRRAVGAAVVAAVFAGRLAAQQTMEPNLAMQGGGAPGGVAQLAFAHRLFAIGLARRDALDLVAAARLAGAVSVVDVVRTKVTEPVDGTTRDEPGGRTPAPIGPAAMLDAARQFAGNDDALLSLVDRAANDLLDGRVTAAKTPSDLGAGQRDLWTLAFFGGVLAEVAVIGNGDGTLAVRVADENDATICTSISPDDLAYCDWIPVRNGQFTVTVTNQGSLRDTYLLLTN